MICGVAFRKDHANVIPNLVGYGGVMRSTGDLVVARSVYERVSAIHELNSGEGQQAGRLQRCVAGVEVSDGRD